MRLCVVYTMQCVYVVYMCLRIYALNLNEEQIAIILTE